MTVTVACLIKARDKEASSREAVEQEVSGGTEPKTGALAIVVPFSSSHSPLSVLISLSSQSRNFHLEASLNLHTLETELAIVFTSNIFLK